MSSEASTFLWILYGLIAFLVAWIIIMAYSAYRAVRHALRNPRSHKSYLAYVHNMSE